MLQLEAEAIKTINNHELSISEKLGKTHPFNLKKTLHVQPGYAWLPCLAMAPSPGLSASLVEPTWWVLFPCDSLGRFPPKNGTGSWNHLRNIQLMAMDPLRGCMNRSYSKKMGKGIPKSLDLLQPTWFFVVLENYLLKF